MRVPLAAKNMEDHVPKEKTTLSLLASAACLTATVVAANAAESCSANPADAPAQIAQDDMQAQLGAVPKPTKPLHIVYIAKTLYGYSQAIAQGIKDESKALGDIKAEIQAPKDESSPVEQLNMAQSVLQQKPDAILMSPSV